MKPALLVNPNAWQNAKDPSYRSLLLRSFDGLGESSETQSVDAIAPLLRSWYEQGVDLLVVSGGDGVFHRVVQEMIRIWPRQSMPKLLPLHGGTIGVIARAAASPPPLAALSLLRLALSRQETLPTKTLATLSIGERTAFNFGVGLFSFVTKEYAEHPWRGPFGVQRVAFKMLASCAVNGPFANQALRQWPGELRLDGAPVEPKELVGIYASALDNMWEFKGFPKQDVPAGQIRTFHIHTNPRGFLKGILPFTMGWNVASSASIRFVSELVVSCQEPYQFLADGEFYQQEEPLSIRSGPVIEVVRL